MGEALWQAIAALPRGSGIVVRHYGLPPAARLRLLRRIEAVARPARHLVAIADPPPRAKARAVHVPRFVRRPPGTASFRSLAVHTPAEARRARCLRADAAFVSPVYPTASHPGARTLGRFGLAALARLLACPVIALGGMTEARFRRLGPLGAHGYAAIDAWLANPQAAGNHRTATSGPRSPVSVRALP